MPALVPNAPATHWCGLSEGLNRLLLVCASCFCLQEEEKKIRAEQIAVEEYTARQHMERQEDLVNLEMTAKKNVYDKMAAKRQDLIDQEVSKTHITARQRSYSSK